MSAYKKLVAGLVDAERRLQDAREITKTARAAEERAEKEVSIARDALGTFHKKKLAEARELGKVDAEKVQGWFA
jgi:hypothetical protein